MIRFTLKCDNDHRFESWFKSGEAFDKLHAAGMVSCTDCGSTRVEKSLMAPRVRPARNAATTPAADNQPDRPLSSPETDAEAMLAKLRRHVEENSDYVGDKFASEARSMYLGETPARAIHGEAKPDEAKALIEDGVPVAPLPFRPARKSN
ncbi:DUF1178 family protein [Shimia biformata]|uniref:DUF1178 family protein n=1 Tax=Shimia biformata TaxID=1294299 RepID=UPI00194EE4E1|nr:DUF1178 family protein [Shimia biformata]